MADKRFKTMIRNKTFQEILQRNGFRNNDIESSVSLSTLSILLDANGNLRTIDPQGNPVIISIEGASDSYYSAGSNISDDINLNHSNGAKQKATINGASVVRPPSNGTEGSEVTLWIIPTGGNQEISFDGSILIPSDSLITLPKILTQDKLYIIKLIYNGTAWMLISLVGGF